MNNKFDRLKKDVVAMNGHNLREYKSTSDTIMHDPRPVIYLKRHDTHRFGESKTNTLKLARLNKRTKMRGCDSRVRGTLSL